MHWECRKLPRPSGTTDGTSMWLEPPDADDPGHENRKLGANPDAECGSILFYPIIGNEDTDFQLRDKWYMVKRIRPMTPAPNNAPMPDKQPTQQDKARVYSVHLRPWVLDRPHVTKEVPHVVDLDQPIDCSGDDPACAGEGAEAAKILGIQNRPADW